MWLDLPCLLLNNLRIFSLYRRRSSEGIGVLSKLIDVLLNLIWCKIAKILPHTIFFRVQEINECRRIESFLQNLSHKHLLLFLKFQVSGWFYIFALLFCLHLCFLLHSFYLFHIFLSCSALYMSSYSALYYFSCSVEFSVEFEATNSWINCWISWTEKFPKSSPLPGFLVLRNYMNA